MLLIVAAVLLVGLLYTDIKSSFHRTADHPMNGSPKLHTYLAVAVMPWKYRRHWDKKGYFYYIASRLLGLAAIGAILIDLFIV